MGYRMFTGSRLEQLVQAHLDEFGAGFFGPRPVIVVQNQSLAQWLKLSLARARGGYATGDFVFQDELLRRLIGEGEERVLFIDELKFELYRLLSQADDPALAPLLRGTSDPARLFELADHLAGVFHGYAMNSRIWPAALTSGTPPGAANAGVDAETFGWQSALWRLVLKENTLAGLVLERLTDEPPRPSGPPPRVVIVGSAFLSRRAAAFLRAWAERGLIDVTHLLLLPSPLPAADWPDRRPWTSWGAFGKAFLESLPGTSGEIPQGNTALAKLQTSLAGGSAFDGIPDGTLEVVSCPHPLRELETLRDRLLAALAADPTLEVNDIAVLAPDINVYAPFLDAAFFSDDAGRRLGYHVIDLDLGRENAWFRALDALLALLSAVDRPSLFALIDAAPFREAWNVEEDERLLWLEYTEAVSAWREDGEGTPQSWSASWDRLFGGWFRADETSLNVPPSAFRALGRFHDLLETLGELREQTSRRRGFLEWVRFLETAAARFLTADDAGTALSGRLRTLAETGSDFALPWAGFRSFVQDQIAHFPGRRGQLLTEGVHCSSLRPLRAIPFRVIAVLGLDEGAFPRRDAAPSFDLGRFEDGNEALSAPSLDRYCFWETVMAARDLLYLSYRGRSADGAERPPSPALADLIDHLETSRPWPLTEASAQDFSTGGVTWSPRTLRRARAAAVAAGLPLPLDRSLPPLPPDAVFPEVTADDVTQAFTRPAMFHLRRVRQIVLRDEDRRGVEDEEPWSLPFLEKHAWLDETLRRALDGEPAESADERLRRAVALGQTREGVFTDRDRRELTRRARQTSAWADELRNEGWRTGDAPSRTRWADRPWSAPARGLARGGELLFPELLYGKQLPMRTRFAMAVTALQLAPARPAWLSTLNPDGVRKDYAWTPPADLERAAEAYWTASLDRPFPFYPDVLERVPRLVEDGASLEEALIVAWDDALDTRFGSSESTFGRDPYARLAFADGPDAPTLADLERWWEPLFVPLLGAWR